MTKTTLSDAIAGFDPISLEQLNNSMSLMERKERKFLLTEDNLPQLFSYLKEHYRVLTINGLHVFDYDNVYMDTQDFLFYHQHEWGAKTRTKVRTRQYVNSNLNFFEYKQKAKKQITKWRYEISEFEHGKITMEGMRFFQGIYTSIYNEKLNKLLTPSLRNTYKRVTFCSKKNDERITIDFAVSFHDPINLTHMHKMENIAIVESKAATQPAPSASIFEKLWMTEQKACSKYCLGMNYLWKVTKNDHFKWTLHDILELQLTHANKVLTESFNSASSDQ